METYYFVEELPLAIEYGLSIDEFWNGDIDLFYAYQKAYINKIHKQAHIQGIYTKLALELGVSNILKKKEDKYIDFPKEDIFNPFNNNINIVNNNDKLVNKIDVSKNNNELYQLKEKLKERRKVKDGK